MDIKGLIKKVDQDRKQLVAYPSLKELIPTKSVYQNNFLMQLNTILDSHKHNDETKKLKQALDITQKSGSICITHSFSHNIESSINGKHCCLNYYIYAHVQVYF